MGTGGEPMVSEPSISQRAVARPARRVSAVRAYVGLLAIALLGCLADPASAQRITVRLDTGISSDDNVNLETDEIGREVREAIVSTLRIAVLDADVLSLDPSAVAET